LVRSGLLDLLNLLLSAQLGLLGLWHPLFQYFQCCRLVLSDLLGLSDLLRRLFRLDLSDLFRLVL
jgi:hypothetical protein